MEKTVLLGSWLAAVLGGAVAGAGLTAATLEETATVRQLEVVDSEGRVRIVVGELAESGHYGVMALGSDGSLQATLRATEFGGSFLLRAKGEGKTGADASIWAMAEGGLASMNVANGDGKSRASLVASRKPEDGGRPGVHTLAGLFVLAPDESPAASLQRRGSPAGTVKSGAFIQATLDAPLRSLVSLGSVEEGFSAEANGGAVDGGEE